MSTPIRQLPTTPVDTRTVKVRARSQDGACSLEPETYGEAVRWAHKADTRDGLAGMWQRTDANEPQHTNVACFGKP